MARRYIAFLAQCLASGNHAFIRCYIASTALAFDRIIFIHRLMHHMEDHYLCFQVFLILIIAIWKNDKFIRDYWFIAKKLSLYWK
jgi:Na+-transporting NADH:ubiquinone oxidoreductase subunit NqrB